jgi:hypothetical protein
VGTAAALCDLYTRMLGHPAGPADTFSELGGDSLSFVETSIKLERLLGRLPDDWQHTPIRDLAAEAKPAARRWATLDITVFLRAIAIVMVVLEDSGAFPVYGGAHTMLGIVGYNLARFQFDGAPPLDRFRRVVVSLARIVIPMMLWVAAVIVFLHQYSPINLFLGYYLTSGVDVRNDADFWFIEILVFYSLGTALLFSTRLGYRLERRYPFGLPMVLTGIGLVPRFDLVPGLTANPYVSSRIAPLVIFWVFTIGWATARADTTWKKLAVTATILVSVHGFFGYAGQDEIVAAGLILLVWIRALPSTPLINRVLGTLAASSLFIYVTDDQVYTRFAWAGHRDILGVVASIVFGVAYAALWKRVRLAARLFWARLRAVLGRTTAPVAASTVGVGAIPGPPAGSISPQPK